MEPPEEQTREIEHMQARQPDPIHHLSIDVDDAVTREHALGVVWQSGALGVEERSDLELVIYAPSSAVATLRASLLDALGDRVRVGESAPVEEVDWSESWKQGLEAIEVAPSLVVAPTFIELEPRPGRVALRVDPGQAFGTGGHSSTRLVLEWIAELAAQGRLGERCLDVGTGSGVLAMAAVALGARAAVGFDLDPLAAPEAGKWADVNGLADRTRFFTGDIEDALAEPAFDLVLANLLKREILPIAEPVAAAVAARGRLVLSGLLEEDGPECLAAFAALGWREEARRMRVDDNGDRWISPCLVRAT